MTSRRLSISVAFVAVILAIPGYLERLWRVLDDTTVYAPGFSESQFQSLRPGLSRDAVIRIMGRPLEEKSNAGSPGPTSPSPLWSYLAYSTSEAGGSYHIRRVWLDREGRVSLVETGWYQD